MPYVRDPSRKTSKLGFVSMLFLLGFFPGFGPPGEYGLAASSVLSCDVSFAVLALPPFLKAPTKPALRGSCFPFTGSISL